MPDPTTDRTSRTRERLSALPDWMKWLGGIAAGAISTAVTIGIMIGASQTRLAAAEAHVERNRTTGEVNRSAISELKAKVDASDARAEERHRALMSMLQSIEQRITP